MPPKTSESAKDDPMRRVSVVHLLHTMAYGGIETVLINWFRRFDRTRIDAHLVVFANPGGTEQPFIDAATRLGIPVSTIPWGRRKPLIKASRALAGTLRAHGAQVLHTHGYYADMVGPLAGRLAGVKTITTLYVWIGRGLNWKRSVLQTLDGWAARWFDQISVHCEETGRQTVARGIRPERLKTLICGFEPHPVTLSPSERTTRRRAAGAADDELVLVNVARLYPEKTQDALLRSFQRIHAACPRTRLWIAGIGPLDQELRALTRALGLDEAVRFVGFVDDLPELLALCDVQLHPAAIEGVPLAVCAGMVAELPVVASAVGGIPEVVKDGVTGVLVPPSDEAAFADAAIELLRDPVRRRELGQAARRFIEQEYSLEVAVRRVEQTYREMLTPA